MKLRAIIAMLASIGSGCDDAPVQEFAIDASAAIDGGIDATVAYVDAGDQARDTRDAATLPYARDVVSFEAGSNAGFGREALPGVVLGPPRGKGNSAGSLDVLSLGVGGEIVLDFGERNIVDRAGPDFIVFENAFWPGGSSAAVYAELGEVSISNDLTVWQTFPCSQQATAPGVYPGCAGWTPTLMYDPFAVVPLDPTLTGGDAFDLATVSATSARYVRVRDLASSGAGNNAGFDLDAVGVIHSQ